MSQHRFQLEAIQDELVQFALDCAQGKVEFSNIKAWLKSNSFPVE